MCQRKGTRLWLMFNPISPEDPCAKTPSRSRSPAPRLLGAMEDAEVELSPESLARPVRNR